MKTMLITALLMQFAQTQEAHTRVHAVQDILGMESIAVQVCLLVHVEDSEMMMTTLLQILMNVRWTMVAVLMAIALILWAVLSVSAALALSFMRPYCIIYVCMSHPPPKILGWHRPPWPPLFLLLWEAQIKPAK